MEKKGSLETEVRYGLKNGCKMNCALKSVMRYRTMGMDAKGWLCEGVVVSTILSERRVGGWEKKREEDIM